MGTKAARAFNGIYAIRTLQRPAVSGNNMSEEWGFNRAKNLALLKPSKSEINGVLNTGREWIRLISAIDKELNCLIQVVH